MLPNEPPTEDGFERPDLYGVAEDAAIPPDAARPGDAPADDAAPTAVEMLRMVAAAERHGSTFGYSELRASWDRAYRAVRNEHFQQSKYVHADYRSRSKIFRPKTRTAVRKDLAATGASLFSTVSAISCRAGNEADPKQRAAASVVQELVNYRTDRTSGRAAFPWFRISMGARSDATITGVCFTKQSWRLEFRRAAAEPVINEQTGLPEVDETGQPIMVDVFEPEIDRPDMTLVPPENALIDPAADWLDPVQSARFFCAKYPMGIDEVREKAKSPLNPWNEVSDSQMRSASSERQEAKSTRGARDGGVDRYDQNVTGTEFETVWVYENFFKKDGKDWHFWSIGEKVALTDPREVREVYPEQFGERPYVMGIASLEPHRLFPMAPVESWQQLQAEINDVANLSLDTVKQAVSPIAKVARGRQVDIAAVQRRAAGTTLLLNNPAEDVIWDRPPDLTAGAIQTMERLNVDFDTLAGQFDQGSVSTNRRLNETVGGMKLINSAANAMQEFDLRVWIETWAEPALGQIVRLIQYYEHDPVVLGIAGDRAQLFQKHGIDALTDELLEKQVSISINVGMGSSDPQQRLGKFASAAQVVGPIMAQHPKVLSGEVELDLESIVDEVFGAAGYADGGRRFIKFNEQPKPPPPPPPDVMAKVEDLQASAKQKLSTAQLNAAKTAEISAGIQMDRASIIRQFLQDAGGARQQGVDNDFREREAAARQKGEQAKLEAATQKATQQPAKRPAPQEEAEPEPAGVPPEALEQLLQMLSAPRARDVEFVRDANGRISGARIVDQSPQGAERGQ